MKTRIASLLIVLLASTITYAQAPWLVQKDQARLKSLWPEEVPWPETMKFYKLPMAQQRIKILDDRSYYAFHLTDKDEEKEIWTVSGGLHSSPRSEWGNVTGLAIPKGKKIKIWIGQRAIPRTGQLLDSLEWEFPTGTVAVDVLIRIKPKQQYVFELRMRTKKQGGWDSIAYRPYEIPKNAVKKSLYSELPNGHLNALKITDPKVVYTFWQVKEILPSKLMPNSKLLRDDSGFLPKHYYGPGLSCKACHNRAGDAVDYGVGCVPGKDTVLSWRPNTEATVNNQLIGVNPAIDGRWPVEWK
jgi:hypothetical protein